MPAFHGPNGQFDQQTFEAVLRNNGLTEPRFLDMVRGDLAQQQLLGAVSAGAAAPERLLHPLFEGQVEKRSADMVEFPFAAAPAAAPPTEAELQRWYDNHPDDYSAPEYRRIKAIVLSPQTLAKDIPITDEDLHAAYEQHKAEYVKPEQRSAQVIPAPDEAKAKALARMAGRCRLGGDAEGGAGGGGSAIALDDATERQFPDADLAHAVFAAAPDTVAGPRQGRARLAHREGHQGHAGQRRAASTR